MFYCIQLRFEFLPLDLDDKTKDLRMTWIYEVFVIWSYVWISFKKDFENDT